MQTARRLYLYLLSGIGLGVLVSGISLLLTTLFGALGLGSGPTFGGDTALRERLTLATALTVVALPVWLIHWLAAERGVRPGRTNAADERSSGVRGLYFAVAMAALLVAAASAAITLVETVVLAISGTSIASRNPAGDLALLLVAGAAWGYHFAIRMRDWRRGPISGAGAWLPRTYLYGSALVGLLMMLFGLADLLGMVIDLALRSGEPSFGGDSWWAMPLAGIVARIAVGGAVWVGHWWYAGRLLADGGHRGSVERPARLRLTFYVALLVVAAAATIGYAGQAVRVLLEMALGVSDLATSPALAAIGSSAAAAVIFAAAWWVHARWLHNEARSVEDTAHPETSWRLAAYPLALVGLAYGAVALAWLIGLLLEVTLGGGRTLIGADFVRVELASALPYALLGMALWLWQWGRIGRRRTAQPEAEGTSTVRRAAILVVLAATVVAGIVTLGVILYRLLGTLFGLEAPGDVVSELRTPIGGLLVAVGLAAYHGVALRRDQALRVEVGATEPAVPSLAERSLRLSGPPGEQQMETVIALLRTGLPEGYALEDADPDERRMS
jgi:hypothetical protein